MMNRKDGVGSELTPLQQALLTIEKLQRKLVSVTSGSEDAIAIIGMGCRFPGGASGTSRFRELLWGGREAVMEVPAERRSLQGIHDPDPAAPGKSTLRRAAFVEGVERFDAEFFRISRREAEGMDPQQRFFLEVCWEALEDAGLPPHALRGTRTGVFAGVHARDYALIAEGGLEKVGPHYSSGVDASYVPGRLSYLLGLEGPSLAVDTACSSSLVAVHLACQSLHAGESTVAIAGGVKLLLAPHLSVFLTKAGALSPTQRCRAFDAAADGMVQGEGCGVVILKRLRDALRDGDRVLATLRATAMNHDGASGGLTVPNVRAQESLYRLALQRAGIEPGQVDYLEAHGTGTRLGDPIELEGVARVYGAAHSAEHPLWMGSLKPNIGHTEAAAGIAGLIKAVCILQSGTIPPSLHFEHPTPEFSWAGSGLAVVREHTPLTPQGRAHRVAVSSFGMSGMNAHAIVESYREAPSARTDAGPYLLPLSARSEAGLRELASAWLRQLTEVPDANLRDACFTAGAGRSHHEQRMALVAQTPEVLRALLRSAAEGRSGTGIHRGSLTGAPPKGATFLFGDDVEQVDGLVRELLARDPASMRQLEGLDAAFRRVAGWSVSEHLARGSRGPQAAEVRARGAGVLLACQLALVAWWRACGVEPLAVAGHGTGGIAAAVVAGLLTEEEAIRLALRLPDPEPFLARTARCHFFSFAEESWLSEGAMPPSGRWVREAVASEAPDWDLVAEHLVARDFASIFLEVACSGALADALDASARRRGREVLVLKADPRDGGEVLQGVLTRAARVYCAGLTLRFDSLFPEARKASAPTYPWQRERYWWDGQREAPRLLAPPPPEVSARWEGLLWDLAWRPREAVPESAGRGGRWLAVTENLEAARPLREAWGSPHGELVVACAGPTSARATPGEHRVDFGQGASFAQLLEEVAASGEPLRGVLFLASQDPVDESAPRGASARRQAVAFTFLAQAMARTALPGAPRLVLVTRGAQAEEESLSLAGASLWGLARVLAHEHAELRCKRVDLDARSGVEALRVLPGELAIPAASDDDEVKYRGGQRFVSALIPGQRAAGATGAFRPRADRSYVVTGGLGGIGLRLAQWLVSQGARHLSLWGRSGESAQAREVLGSLRAAGARVETCRVDVGQRDAVADVLDALRRGGPPLGGVFHCAGVLADASFLQLEPAAFDTVMGPKVDGAWNLHTLATDATVEQFVLFSSTAGLVGSPGQGNYAAANAFLDALARLRRARGLPALSLQWGSWGEVGMAATDARRGERLAERGMSPMSVDEALALMAVTLADAPANRGIARFEPKRWAHAYPAIAGSSLFRELLPRAEEGAGAVAPRQLREVLLSLEGDARARALEARLKEMIAEVSRVAPERLSSTDSFEALGFDSIMALEMRDLVLAELDVGLPLKSFVDEHSIAQVVGELLERLAVARVLTAGTSERTDTKRVLL
ncbi:polyketide synthase [Corallococcus sp. H22C18031201]|nr:polyketide synthase [Corallococcus sp. H22C18031201]